MVDFKKGNTDMSAHFTLNYEDMDGRESSFGLTMAFDGTFDACQPH